MRPVLVALAAGWLYGLAFPPIAARWLAWIALAPLVVLARTRGVRAAAMAGALYAVAGTCATVDWLPRTVAVYYAQPVLVGVGLFLAVTLATVVPPVAAFAASVSVTRTLPAWLRPLVVAAAWTATELWRAHALGGNPWVLVGYSQAPVRLVAQVADLAGPYGIGFVVLTINAALAEVVLAMRRRVPRGEAVAGAGVAAVVVAAALAYGAWTPFCPRRDEAATVPVAAVQGNLDLGAQWKDEFYGMNLEAYLRLTVAALRQRPARLVVWPEAAVTFFLAREPLHRAAIASVLTPFGAELVTGGPHVVEDGHDTFRNAAYLLAPDGEIRGRYDKERLLPFAEYFPFASLDLVKRSFGRVRSFEPGPPAASPLATVAGRAGVLICNEAMFPELARSRVRDGAELLLVLTNDTWVGDPKFAGIAFDMAVLRAIETRRWLIRASTAGPSAIVDPMGVARASIPYGTQATLAGEVAPRHGLTPYARWGDVFAFACAVVTFGGVSASLRRRARRREAA